MCRNIYDYVKSHKVFGYNTLAIVAQILIMVMSIIALVRAVANYKPDRDWNIYLKKVIRTNQVEAFFGHARFYIAIDPAHFEKNKAEYVAAHSDRVVKGFVTTLMPTRHGELKSKNTFMPFGTVHMLKGEMILRRKKLLNMEFKETKLQIITMGILSGAILVSFIELIMAIGLYKKNLCCRPLNIAFDIFMALVMLSCLTLYIWSSRKIRTTYNRITKIVAELAIEMYKKGGYAWPYDAPPSNIKFKPEHIIHGCSIWKYDKEKKSYTARPVFPPRYSCDRKHSKIVVMLLLGASVLAYIGLTFLNYYFMKKNETKPLELKVEREPPGYKHVRSPKKRGPKPKVFSVERAEARRGRRSSFQVPDTPRSGSMQFE